MALPALTFCSKNNSQDMILECKYGLECKPCKVNNLTNVLRLVWTVNFEEDLLASGSWDKTIKLWSTKTGGYIDTLKGQEVRAVAFTSDGILA